MIGAAPRLRRARDRPSVRVRLFELPCLFAGNLHSILCRDCYGFVWYLGRKVPCDVGHLQAPMTHTGHWAQGAQGRELDIAQLRQLLQQRPRKWTSTRRDATSGRSSATDPS